MRGGQSGLIGGNRRRGRELLSYVLFLGGVFFSLGVDVVVAELGGEAEGEGEREFRGG